MTPPSDHRRRLVPAPHLRTVRAAHATVLIDYRTGAVNVLTGDTRTVWLSHINHGTPATTTGDEPGVEAIRADLARRGWLVTPPRHLGPPVGPHQVIRLPEPAVSWGTRDIPAQLHAPDHTPWRWRLAAIPMLTATIGVRHLGRRRHRFARLLFLARLGQRLPPGTPGQAQQAVHAVRWAARLIPARVACLEESVAATLLLAATRRRATWHHGIATDPIRLHAWITDHTGQPVAEPNDTRHYTTIIRTPTNPEDRA